MQTKSPKFKPKEKENPHSLSCDHTARILHPHDLEPARALRLAPLLGGRDQLAADDLVLRPAARRQAHAGDEPGHDEKRPQGRLAVLVAAWRRAAAGEERLAAVEDLGADMFELAELCLVAVFCQK